MFLYKLTVNVCPFQQKLRFTDFWTAQLFFCFGETVYYCLSSVCFLTTWRFWLMSSSISQIRPWCSTGSVTGVQCCSFRLDQRSAGPLSPLCRDTHMLYSPLLSFSLTARKHTTHTSTGCGARVHSTYRNTEKERMISSHLTSTPLSHDSWDTLFNTLLRIMIIITGSFSYDDNPLHCLQYYSAVILRMQDAIFGRHSGENEVHW